jgi:DNA-binding HxlR family transcriptional regulator
MRIEKKPGCIEATARILGDKWSPLLVRALTISPLRFCELQKNANNINPRTLSSRLAWLEQNGIITRAVRDNSPPYTEYALTQKGADLLPILINMADWGEKYGSETLPDQTVGE